MLMLVFLLSLAGIPPLAGFWGKYFIFLSLMETGHYALAAVAVLFAVVGLYYYLRIANADVDASGGKHRTGGDEPGLRLALAITALGTVAIGIFPEVFLRAAAWSLSVPQASAVLGLLR